MIPHWALVVLILLAIALLPLAVVLIAVALSGLGVFDPKHERDEEMRRWLQANAEERDRE